MQALHHFGIEALTELATGSYMKHFGATARDERPPSRSDDYKFKARYEPLHRGAIKHANGVQKLGTSDRNAHDTMLNNHA